MNNVKYLVLFFLLWLQIISCSPLTNSEVDLQIKSKNVVLINAKQTSCKASSSGSDPDLSALSFVLPKITINWKGKKNLSIVYFKMVLTGSQIKGGKFIITFNQEELSYILAGVNADVFGRVLQPSDQPYENSCAFRVGGVPIANDTQPAFGSGILYLYGVTPDENDNYIDVQSQASFTFSYSGTY